MNEQWRVIPGHVGYEVSDLGRVRSLDRIKSYESVRNGKALIVQRLHRGKFLAPGTVKSGHQLVMLGRGVPRFVHTLVLEAFVGACPSGMECCHYDDDPTNNKLENLRWDSRAANMRDFERNYGRRQGKRKQQEVQI